MCLSPADPGNDGAGNNYAEDEYGMILSYYNGDFTRSYTEFNDAARITGTPLYNGNISAWENGMSQRARKLVNWAPQITAHTYKYDVLNRLLGSSYFKKDSVNPTIWISGSAFGSSYSYDPNGNIMSLNRYDTLSIIDSLDYFYNTVGGLPSNRLNHVSDNIANTPYDKDIESGQGSDNYTYDESGNLTSDVQEGITRINWTPDGKVQSVEKSGSVINFYYDSRGDRVVKRTFDGEYYKYTYYIRDANGLVLAIYDQYATAAHPSPNINSWLIYGAKGHDRFATVEPHKKILYNTGDVSDSMFSRDLRQKFYEYKDHLGNVRLVFSDLKQVDGLGAFYLDSLTIYDYYPFGMLKPGRYRENPAYRYGFNGKEKDDDIKGTGNSYTTEFRMNDPRLGRWWSLDPKPTASVSWYASMGNSPVMKIDPNGDYDELSAMAIAGGCDHALKMNEAAHSVDNLQTGLDILGFSNIPLLDQGADIINGTISAARGNWTDAALTFAGVIPFIGDAGKLLKDSRKAGKTIKNTEHFVEGVEEGSKIVKKVEKSEKEVEGVYEVDKTLKEGKPYIGQSGKTKTRLKQHVSKQKISKTQAKVAKVTPVEGGTTARRVVEQIKINEKGGIENLANKINAVAPKFWEKFNIPTPKK